VPMSGNGGEASGGLAEPGNGGGGTAGGSPGGTAGMGGPCVATGDNRSPTMNAGLDCTGCHGFKVAGTLYPALHTASFCDGVDNSAGATIELTDANGARLTLTPNRVGNFFDSDSNTSLVMPYTAVVRTARGTRAMQTKQMVGNCNGCHTESGSNGAPGRIMVP